MKRYLAFYGRKYYPCGGMEDFVGDFEDFGDAITFLEKCREEDDREDWDMVWSHIYDPTEERIVWERPFN